MTHRDSGMDRRSFLKAGLTGAAGLGALSSLTGPLTGAGRAQAAAPAQAIAKPKTIHTRKLGKTGLTLPIVSFGVMNSDNPNLIQAALDSGILLLDTAHGYMRGRNEEVIGQVLKGRPRDSFVLATKIQGQPRDGRTGNFSPETSAETFLQMLDLSLKRLGLDHVDILYLHNVLTREAVLFEPLMKALEAAKKSGKTRFIGVSTHGNEHEVIRAVLEGKLHDVVLSGYNFRKENLAELDAAIADAAKAGVGIIAMKSLAGGYWDGRSRQQPIPAKAALKWALQNPNVASAIPGMTSFDQLEANLSVLADPVLTEEEKASLAKGPALAAGLYCQGCGACLPQCPRALPIPSLMRSYMYAYGYRNLREAYDTIGSLGVGPEPCGDCGSCSVRCRSGFDVRERVTDIARLAAVPEDLLG